MRRTFSPGTVLCWRAVVALSAVCSVLLLASAGSRAADIFAGQAVYQEHCARCHGKEGKPVLPNVPDFTRGEKMNAPDMTLIRSIKAGGGLMPSFNRIVKDRDILNALAFIRSLQR